MLREFDLLAATVENVLGAQPDTGEIRIRGCSAIVKPENAGNARGDQATPSVQGLLGEQCAAGVLAEQKQLEPVDFHQAFSGAWLRRKGDHLR